VLAAAAVYLPAAAGADWITDDRHLIAGHLRPGDVLGEWTTATHAHASDVVGGYLWRPLTSTVYQIWGELFGRSPGPFRVLAALAHLLNVGLVGLASRRLGAGPRAAAVGALVFALHPLGPDAVCWISDLYDVMAASFLLGGLAVAVGANRVGARAGVGALLFLGALLCKEAALSWVVALPAALLLLRGWRPAALHGAGLVVVAAAHGRWHGAIVGGFERSALDLMRDGPFLETWLDYLWWPLGMPVRAGFTHLLTPGEVPINPGGVAVFLALLVSLALAVRRPSGANRALAVGLGVWSVMLAPGALAASSFLNQSARYLYLPLALAIPALVLAADRAAARLPRQRRAWVALVGLAWAIAWAPRTLGRVGDWQSEPALYLAEHEAEPANAFAGKELGRILFAAGSVDAGITLWSAAVADPPASRYVMDVQAERLDLAQAAASVGRTALALQCLDDFIAAEAAAGRAVDPSVHGLRDRIAGTAP
jgi:protein O-mannosyl-transferase